MCSPSHCGQNANNESSFVLVTRSSPRHRRSPGRFLHSMSVPQLSPCRRALPYSITRKTDRSVASRNGPIPVEPMKRINNKHFPCMYHKDLRPANEEGNPHAATVGWHPRPHNSEITPHVIMCNWAEQVCDRVRQPKQSKSTRFLAMRDAQAWLT